MLSLQEPLTAACSEASAPLAWTFRKPNAKFGITQPFKDIDISLENSFAAQLQV